MAAARKKSPRKKPAQGFDVPDSIARKGESGWVYRSESSGATSKKKAPVRKKKATTAKAGQARAAAPSEAVTTLPAVANPAGSTASGIPRRAGRAFDLLWWPFAAAVTGALAITAPRRKHTRE